jgi:hypothetical protein
MGHPNLSERKAKRNFTYSQLEEKFKDLEQKEERVSVSLKQTKDFPNDTDSSDYLLSSTLVIHGIHQNPTSTTSNPKYHVSHCKPIASLYITILKA